MYYSNDTGELNYYKLNQWVTDTSTIFTQLIVQELEQSCLYKSVISSNLLVASDYRLIIQVMNFKQYIHNDQSTVQLLVSIQLINNNTNHIVKNKIFTTDIKTSPDIQGYIKGSNIAINNFLKEMLVWIK